MCYRKRGYWERLVNTDEQRRSVFPSDFNGIRFKEKIDVPLHILESKFKYDFPISMCHLITKYRISLFDFQIYRPNLITNDGFIDHHQKHIVILQLHFQIQLCN